MNSRSKQLAAGSWQSSLLWAVPLLFAAALGLQAMRDRTYGADLTTDPQLLYVRTGEVMKRMALSFDGLLADVYWIRALQHFGGERLFAEEKRYDLLYPLLDLATSLDPDFTIVYRFGAHFLSEPPPGGPGTPDLAVALLEKGYAHDRSKWQYLQDIGFIHYWWHGDYETAAQWFQRAGELPGAPTWLRPLAASVLTQGDRRSEARFLWRTILETAEHEWLRTAATKALGQLDALDAIDQLQAAVRAFTGARGRLPANWRELTTAGLIRGVPLDPSGTPYELDPATGEVKVPPASPLFPLPIGLAARPLPPS